MNNVVIETVRGEIEHEISAEEADTVVSIFEAGGFEVRRSWDAVAYVVAVFMQGCAFPVLSYAMPVN